MLPPDEPTETETTEPALTDAEAEAPPEEEPAPEQEAPSEEEGEKPEGEESEAEEAKDGEQAKTEEANAEGEKRKRAGGWQRRIERLERQNAEKDALIQRLATPPAPAAKPEKDKTAEEKAAEYVDNLVEQRLAKREAEQRQKSVITDFQRRTAEVRATKEDFDNVVESVDIPLESALGQVLLTSQHGPDIMYQLALDRKELARLSALPPLDAAREVGRLEAQLSSSTPPAKTNGTAKRPPAPPTSVRGSTSNTRSLEDLPLSEYKRAYRSGRR